jgi:hypothetical protein
LRATHVVTLDVCALDDLKAHAAEEG